MSLTDTLTRGWTIDAFRTFWAHPDPSQLPAIRGVLTEDIVGYWPRPIGVVREPAPYLAVIGGILAAYPDFSLVAPEYAADGDFHFVRWVAQATGPDGRFEANGCDRLRLRDGLVCENYVMSDHPFFARVMAAAA